MSLVNFNPNKMKMDRRRMLALGGGAALMGSGLAACSEEGGSETQTSETAPPAMAEKKTLDLDFKNPNDNLTAWVKLASSLEDGKETCGHYKGTIIAVMGNDQKNIPLFGYEGFGMSRVTKLDDGRYENLHREVSYYTDLRSGQIMEEWYNPFIEENVKVWPVHNDPVNSYYAPTFKQSFGGEGEQETVEFPFILPWEISNDHVVTQFSVHTRWPSPLTKEDWPREYGGKWYKTSELFHIHARMSDLLNPDLDKAHHTGSWTKEAPWIPWMLMGETPGRLLYVTIVRSLESTDDLPVNIREYTEKNFPIHMHAPEKWSEPNMTSFETWVREATPVPLKEG